MLSVRKRWKTLRQKISQSLLDKLPKFHYEPLQDASTEIRLLYLRPATKFIGLEAVPSLGIMNIDPTDEGCPKFCALSYTWGSPLKTPDVDVYNEDVISGVLVNGCWFPVSLNLFLALQQISRNFYKERKDPVIIWVDAICINQLDVPEKNQQVKRMGDIYSQATGTVIWLGPADVHTEAAFRKITAIGRDHDEQNEAARLQDEDPWFGYSSGHILTLGRRLQSHEMGTPRPLTEMEVDETPGIAEIKQLMSRTWWERSWIWQEVACSPTTLIMCGEYEVDFGMFVKLTFAVVTDMATNGRFNHPVDTLFLRRLEMLFLPITRMIKMRHRLAPIASLSERNPINLLIVLDLIRPTTATDPHDKLYAVLGMCEGGYGIRIDYDLPTHLVYIDLVQQYIAVNSDLSIFNYCNFPPGLDDLPSWAPDWTHRIACRYQLERLNSSLDRGPRLFHAGGPPYVQPEVNIDSVAGTASLTGFVFSTITLVARDDPHLLEKRHHLEPEAGRILFNIQHGVLAMAEALWLRQWAVLRPHGGIHSTTVKYAKVKRSRRGRRIRKTIFQWTGRWRFNYKANSSQFESLTYYYTGENVLQAYLRTLYADTYASPLHGEKRRLRDWDTLPDDANMDSISIGRTFAATAADVFVLVPVETQPGDVIAIFKGGELPYVLRPTPKGHLMIGECYLHGFMDGEAFIPAQLNDAWCTITLV